MSERYYRRKYKNEPKANLFEFVTETIAQFGVEWGILGPLAKTQGITFGRPDDISYLSPMIYYAYKDLLFPQIVEKLVYYLAGSSLGRWIIRKLARIEDQLFITIAINTFVIITIQKLLGVDEIDIIQILTTQMMEFGADYISDGLL